MKYHITVKSMVEAESAEAAAQMVFDKTADSVGEVKVTPTKKWDVSIELIPVLKLSVPVTAESAEDAESKVYHLVDNTAHCYGVPGVIELAEWFGDEVVDLDIYAYDATPVDDEAEPTEPATAPVV